LIIWHFPSAMLLFNLGGHRARNKSDNRSQRALL